MGQFKIDAAWKVLIKDLNLYILYILYILYMCFAKKSTIFKIYSRGCFKQKFKSIWLNYAGIHYIIGSYI